MLLTAFTISHVVLSLIGIGSGFVVVYGLIDSKRLNGATKLFLATTAATSLTGFLFPIQHFTPALVLGVLSLIVLTLAFTAFYRRNLAGGWRRTYVICSVIALYFNFFVLIVQSFLKIPALHDLAPTQSEPPFQISQLIALLLFVGLGVRASMKFCPDEPLRMA
jgi:hypothetical protein